MYASSAYLRNQAGRRGAAGNADESAPAAGERGYRRRRLAAMAGNMYRAGAAAVNEVRESYAQTRVRGLDGPDGHGGTTIPGSFPEVAITVQGDDQMVIFPSYAKRHTKQDWDAIWKEQQQQQQAQQAQQRDNGMAYGSLRDEEYWRREWERNEDEKAIIDVDVRGWIYSPHKGPMTRRNRILIGLARQLSGIPRPDQPQAGGPNQAEPGLASIHETHEELREQEKIAHEAAKIERRGQEEKKAANRGEYSEAPKDDSDIEGESGFHRTRSGSQTPISPPGSPILKSRQYTSTSTAAGGELTEAELAVANANLMARIAPFMTTPLVQLPITIFFYNEERSQSRTVTTSDAGHFVVRAALDFVPTHVRVLANESLSAIQEVTLIEPIGVSLISDIDDTIKRSNISAGAREIFRNTFVRDLNDLTVDGVREWYTKMHEMGVRIHYCSNSPWQLFPVLATFFTIAGLPPGSLHLKQYSGMLQGIFEPVAERKKGTLERLMRDFPDRKFLLVGDSGEADLEVYTELVVANPGRILAVFIRDVTTPDETNFFDASFGSMASTMRKTSPTIRFADASDDPGSRPILPPRIMEGQKSSGPVMGTLIDFSDEPEEASLDHSAALAQIQHDVPKRSVSTTDLATIGKRPPPRPAKPAALRSTPSETQLGVGLGISGSKAGDAGKSTPQPPPPRKKLSGPTADRVSPHPLSQMHNSSQQTIGSKDSLARPSAPPVNSKPDSASTSTGASSQSSSRPGGAPAPPPRRRGTPSSIMSLSPRLIAHRRTTSNSDIADLEPLPPASAPAPVHINHSGTSRPPRSGTSSPTMGSPTLGPVNRRVELWKRRLQRAHETLDAHGVALYTWRRGEDVVAEAVGLVMQALKEGETRREKAGR